MPCGIVLALLACALFPSRATADTSWPRTSLELFAGPLSARGSLAVAVDPDRTLRSNIGDGAVMGLGVGYAFLPMLSVETDLAAATNPYRVKLFDASMSPPGEPAPEASTIDGGKPLFFFDTGIVVHPIRGPVVPYARGSVGGVLYVQELRSFAYGYGAGVKARLSSRVGVRIEGREYRTDLDGRIDEPIDILPDGTIVAYQFPFHEKLRFRRLTAGLLFLF